MLPMRLNKIVKPWRKPKKKLGSFGAEGTG